jgi:protein TonB
VRELSPALILSTLLHLAAGGALWWVTETAPRVAGQTTVSVSLIDAVEAHRPQPAVQPPKPEVSPPKPQIQPRPAPQPMLNLPTPKPVEKSLEKTADDELESLASLATPLQASAQAEPLSVASFNADYLHNPKPLYPALSRRLGEQGRVLLHVQVSTAGTPLDVTVKESSGFKRLDQAAVETVKRWQFVPAKQGNTALVSWVDVPLQFSLEK